MGLLFMEKRALIVLDKKFESSYHLVVVKDKLDIRASC
jgi:hypothetical protein